MPVSGEFVAEHSNTIEEDIMTAYHNSNLVVELEPVEDGRVHTKPWTMVTSWDWYNVTTEDGIHVRVASSIDDAVAIRDVVRSAWRLGESESFFYGAFNDPQTIFHEVIVPAIRHCDIIRLNTLCLVAEVDHESGRQIVGTVSLVFDHQQRTVELGRGAVVAGIQGRGILNAFTVPLRRIIERVHNYAIVADATVLCRGAGRFAEAFDAVPVALHPSSFTIPQRASGDWIAALSERYDSEVISAMLSPSPMTGCGRFATAYHVRLPTGCTTYRPLITDRQQRFYTHTRRALDLSESFLVQPSRRRRMRMTDNRNTATRNIIDPADSVTPHQLIEDARKRGYETVIVQVPCDRYSDHATEQLEAAGALLCGVFPDAAGYWYASYALFTTDGQRKQVLDNLEVLYRRRALPDSYVGLAAEILDQSTSRSSEGSAHPRTRSATRNRKNFSLDRYALRQRLRRHTLKRDDQLVVTELIGGAVEVAVEVEQAKSGRGTHVHKLATAVHPYVGSASADHPIALDRGVHSVKPTIDGDVSRVEKYAELI